MGAKAKFIAKKTRRGQRQVNAKRGLTDADKLNKLVTKEITQRIEGTTASAAKGSGSQLRVVHAEDPEEKSKPKKRKASSLPAHKTK